MDHDGAVQPAPAPSGLHRQHLALRLISLLVGIGAVVLVTNVVGSLADLFYASRHVTPAASGTGDELGLELVVIFGMFMGFVASIPLGFLVYRFVFRRLMRRFAVA